MGPVDGSDQHLQLITISPSAGAMILSFRDGSEIRFPTTQRVGDSFIRLAVELDPCRLHLTTLRGDLITSELPRLGEPAQIGDRKVVYLDQLHWSTISKVLHGSVDRVSPAEAEAARHLIDLVLHRRIVLPMSAGHVVETTQWGHDQARYQLGLTIATLSGGWIFRDPLAVRREELRMLWGMRQLLTSDEAPPVISLDPAALYADSTSRVEMDIGRPDLDYLASVSLNAMINLDVLMDSEPMPSADLSGWVERFQGFATHLHGEEAAWRRRRQIIDAFFIGDISKELSEEATKSHVSPDAVSEWLRRDSADDLKTSPSLGLFREVVFEKLVNSEKPWESNDLQDVMYLTCASAYVDHVAAERSFTHLIASGLRRLGRSINISRSLVDLVEVI